jgi:chorismate dehydratase
MALLESTIGMKRLRISAISYLNTAPLMWDFEHEDAGSAFEISYTLPSGCAAALADGSADIGIIPAAAYASVPGLVILPEVAIAARGPVRSILLVCKVPLENVSLVALDSSSLTSVALTKVLFKKWWGAGRRFSSTAPNLDQMLERSDAALLIGDSALKVDRTRYLTYDLAEEWIRLTNRPFVFAFWAVRQAALEECSPTLDLSSVFKQSRDNGLLTKNVADIAKKWGPRIGLDENEVRSYLTENIHYQLDPECIEGLNLFYSYAQECGVLSSPPPLQFLESPKSAFVR